jgi:galactose-1-phosphate uridylyltransferase
VATISEEDAARIATAYAKQRGIRPFVVLFCQLDETEEVPFWRVVLEFTDTPEVDIGVHSAFIHVDAITGEPSHIPSL